MLLCGIERMTLPTPMTLKCLILRVVASVIAWEPDSTTECDYFPEVVSQNAKASLLFFFSRVFAFAEPCRYSFQADLTHQATKPAGKEELQLCI